jgi:hypothetical protein
VRTRSCLLLVVAAACAPSPPPIAQTPAVAQCPDVAAPVASAVAPPALPPASSVATPVALVPPPPPASATPPDPVPPPTIGPAQGGPRGSRPCEFRESVDTYVRRCSVKLNADGSLGVTAPGTKLNPDNGFSLRMGGGPNQFTVSGQLDAFGPCRGPFSGPMIAVLDGATRTYEARFNGQCMIVIR